jgi:hypothetical protein
MIQYINNLLTKQKKIFKEFNDDKKCNPDNLRLLYDPSNKNDCYHIDKDPHAYGGFLCDQKTKKWSNICVPYYCDIGYYFDLYQNKCIIDKFTNEEKNEGKSFPIWAIILIVVLVIALIVVIVVMVIKIKKKKESLELEGSIIQKSRISETE